MLVSLCSITGLHFYKIAHSSASDSIETITKDHSKAVYSSPSDEVQIPKQADWVDYGHVLEAGPEGSWDFQWAGATPVGIVKKGNTYFFYYVASDGHRSHDGGPRHRAIGVATSVDGIHFRKHKNNPIMTHNPFDGEEEGANSAGVMLDTNGDFIMYYGAAKGPVSLIVADGRVAISKDGFRFQDVSIVLNHRDRSLYGYGDEIFPVAVFKHEGIWNVYYQPNGGTAPRTLGLAWGPSWLNLRNSAKVLDEKNGGKPVGTWGNVIWLSPEKIALFTQRLWWPNTFIEVRTASPKTPHKLSEPVARYDIPNLKRGTVFFDSKRKTWFMYYNDFDRFWDLKLAPAGELDITPPTAPGNLQARAISHDQVELCWEPATDSDTGVVTYRIYRDGTKIGSTKDFSFMDKGLSELSSYIYGVSAVNFHSVEGPLAQITAATFADTTAPTLINAVANQKGEAVTVVFSEPVGQASAEKITNYSISQEIRVVDAYISTDLKTVTLKTSKHINSLPYTLTVSNVKDKASTPNTITSNTKLSYTYSHTAGLLGHWNFDKLKTRVATDFSGYGHDGIIYGPILQDGAINKAFYFDGVDDHVLVEKYPSLINLTNSSFTFAAWVRPTGAPMNKKLYGILLRVASHPVYYFGLTYNSEQRYSATLVNKSEDFITVESHKIKPGTWHHVAMVVDDSAKQLHLYVDGRSVNDSPKKYKNDLFHLNSDIGNSHPAGEYYIGSSKPDNGAGSYFNRPFKGLIDDVRIYNQALTGEELHTIFASRTLKR